MTSAAEPLRTARSGMGEIPGSRGPAGAGKLEGLRPFLT